MSDLRARVLVKCVFSCHSNSVDKAAQNDFFFLNTIKSQSLATLFPFHVPEMYHQVFLCTMSLPQLHTVVLTTCAVILSPTHSRGDISDL